MCIFERIAIDVSFLFLDRAVSDDLSESNEITEEADETDASSRYEELDGETHGLHEADGSGELNVHASSHGYEEFESAPEHSDTEDQEHPDFDHDEFNDVEEDEMGPPRILRPLPPPPPEDDQPVKQELKPTSPVEVVYSVRDIPISSPPQTFKRRSLPPPRLPPPPPPPASVLPDIPSERLNRVSEVIVTSSSQDGDGGGDSASEGAGHAEQEETGTSNSSGDDH